MIGRDEKLKEIPTDSSSRDEDLDFLANRINSKLIDAFDTLCLLSENLSYQKFNSKNETPYRHSEGTNGGCMGLFSKVLESAQLLRDQIEEDIDHQILVDQSRSLFQDLLILFHGIKQVGPAPTKRGAVEISQEVSQFNHSIWIASETRSPAKLSVRNNLAKTQEEIASKLKHSLENLRVSNHNDVTYQLQLQIDRYNELSEKYEGMKKAFHSSSLIIKEEVARCMLSLDDALNIASDNVFMLRLKRDLSNFKTQLGGLFAKQGQFFDPQNEYGDMQSEFERQKIAWETSLTRQKDCFAEEIRKLEESLHREETAHSSYKESSAKLITKLESEIKILREAKDSLNAETEQLRSSLTEEKFLAEEVSKRQQLELELEKQTTNQLQIQLNGLQKAIEEKETELRQVSGDKAELLKKCNDIEHEKLRLSRECEYLQNDKTSLLEQISRFEKSLTEFGHRAEAMEQQIVLLEKERERLTKELTEKEMNYESDREQLVHTLELVQKEFHTYVERSQSNSSEFKQNYDALIAEYSKKLEQQKNEYETARQTTEAELRAKKDELRELNFKFQTLKDLSSSQEVNLKKKEEKLDALIEERKALQEKVLSLEILSRETTSTQEKSKKYFDLLTNTATELENIKSELEALSHEKQEIESRGTALELENKKLKEENEQLKENISKTNKRLSENINETKSLREQIEREQESLQRKEKELK